MFNRVLLFEVVVEVERVLPLMQLVLVAVLGNAIDIVIINDGFDVVQEVALACCIGTLGLEDGR